MNPELLVRPAASEDAVAVSRLADQLGYPVEIEPARRRIEAIAADARQALLVAELPGHGVVAWMQLVRVAPVFAHPHARMLGLVVDVDHRGHGIGRALVDRAFAWAREQGCNAVEVRTRVEREEAHGFYEALGFKLRKTQRAYRRSLGDGGDGARPPR